MPSCCNKRGFRCRIRVDRVGLPNACRETRRAKWLVEGCRWRAGRPPRWQRTPIFVALIRSSYTWDQGASEDAVRDSDEDFFRWMKNPRWRDPRIYIQTDLLTTSLTLGREGQLRRDKVRCVKSEIYLSGASFAASSITCSAVDIEIFKPHE
ncbi:unnamed protein product [Sphagnum jensenii]